MTSLVATCGPNFHPGHTRRSSQEPATGRAVEKCRNGAIDANLKGTPLKIVALFLLGLVCCNVLAAEKSRVFVLIDIENEPDDAMSLVRFLTYANHFDMEDLAGIPIWRFSTKRNRMVPVFHLPSIQ